MIITPETIAQFLLLLLVAAITGMVRNTLTRLRTMEEVQALNRERLIRIETRLNGEDNDS